MKSEDQKKLVVKNVFLDEDVSFSINPSCYLSVISKIKKRDSLNKKYSLLLKELEEHKRTEEYKLSIAQEEEIDKSMEDIRLMTSNPSITKEDLKSAVDSVLSKIDQMKKEPSIKNKINARLVELDEKITSLSYQICNAILVPSGEEWRSVYDSKQELIEDCINTLADVDFVVAFFLNVYSSYTESLLETTFRVMETQ